MIAKLSIGTGLCLLFSFSRATFRRLVGENVFSRIASFSKIIGQSSRINGPLIALEYREKIITVKIKKHTTSMVLLFLIKELAVIFTS